MLGQYRWVPVRKARRQMFQQMKQKPQGILGGFPRIFVKYAGIRCKRFVCREPSGIVLNFSLTYEMQQRFRACLEDLAQTTALCDSDAHLQHGSTSCLWHSVAVAYYSLWAAERFGIRCDENSLMVGALLHDYFLYDWHIPGPHNKRHGFRHPKIALENARRDRVLNEIERNIIARHMFPLTPKPPRFRESVIVCLVDKVCSLVEVFRPAPYRLLRRAFSRVLGVPFQGELLHDDL